MTYGVAREATSDELALYRTPGKKSRYYAAIFKPHTIYTARVNQTFADWDKLLQVTFDGGSGSIGDVVPDMLLYIGTTAGARDVGVLRVRGIDSTHIYFGMTSGVKIMDNQYLTIVDDFRLLQRHVNIVSDVIYMDGSIAYTDQHADPDPIPIMGGHRVVKMTGVSVDVAFDFSQSYVIDGTGIDTCATTAPTADSITGASTATPTVTFDSVGWHCVYLTVTGDNGKSFIGVRYVYVYNDENMPPRVKIANPAADINNGGWQFEVEAYRNADLDDIHEGTLVILFSVDYWGNEELSIGPVEGSENIEAVGWIGSPESIIWNPERTSVHFNVFGAWYWMQKIAAYPTGLTFKISAPTVWTEFQNLTVDKAVWHFLHWRCTATRILDFFPSGDLNYASEISSLATDLWSQIQEMTAVSIFARPGFNALGQIFIQIHPQLTPLGLRTWATVLEIQKGDWVDEIDLERLTLAEISQANLSGVYVDGGGNGFSYFAVAPGHTYDKYGKPDTVDKLVIADQADIIAKAGLYFGWRNNDLPDIPITFKANIRLIDVFPRSKCEITIAAADTVRGVSYDGGIIPKSISVNFDDSTGRVKREVNFEAETFQALAVKETIPGSADDLSQLPDFSFPSLPEFSLPLPGTVEPTLEGPPKVLVHDKGSILTDGAGLLYSYNFNTDDPEFYQVNGGLSTAQYRKLNKVVVCPGGAVWVGNVGLSAGVDTFLARAPSIGAPFEIIEDYASIQAKYGSTDNIRVCAFNCTGLESEHVVYALTQAGENVKLYEYPGTDDPLIPQERAAFTLNTNNGADISYGGGSWMFTASGGAKVLPPDAGSVTSSPSIGPFTCTRHTRVSTSDKTIHWDDDSLDATSYALATATGNGTTIVNNVGEDYDSNRLYEDRLACDFTGQLLMTRDNTPNPVKSSDGGASYSDMVPALDPLVSWYFAYAGGDGLESHWLAVCASVQLSLDFGTTWVNKSGNISDINPLFELDVVKVIEF